MSARDARRERLLAILKIARAYRDREISFHEMQSEVAFVKGHSWHAATRGGGIWKLVVILLAALLGSALFIFFST